MSALAHEAHSFLKQLLGAEGKQQDELVANVKWNEDEADVQNLKHEGHVLLVGQVGKQQIMNSLTFETISLPPCPF